MVSCAQYYDDTTTYTGDAGSSTNPWAVEDCYDLVKVAKGGLYVQGYYQLVQDIDLNEHSTYKSGFSNVAVTGYAGYTYHIDGKGHSIKNIVLNGYTNMSAFAAMANNTSTFTNINFINMIILNVTGSDPLFNGWITLSNCNFSVYLANVTYSYLLSGGNKTDCTFNIYGTLTNGLFITGATLRRCHINFNNCTVGTEGSTYASNLFAGDGGYLRSCYITGSILFVNSGSGIYLATSDSRNALYIYDSYYAVKINRPQGFTTSLNFMATQSLCFVDKELANCTNSPSYTNVRFLTTEQAKSYDYLSQIGFVVLPAED